MTKRTIEISETQGAQIDALVADGLYANANDILIAALRAAEVQQAKRAKKLNALMIAGQVGIDDIEAGRCETFETPEEIQAFVSNAFNEGIEQARTKSMQLAASVKAA